MVAAFKETLEEMQEADFSRAERPNQSPGARTGPSPDGRDAWFMPDPDRPGKYLQVKPQNERRCLTCKAQLRPVDFDPFAGDVDRYVLP